DIYNGGLNKLPAYADLKAKYGLSDNEIAYIGDDLIDIPVMEQVRFPIAVQNAHPRVKAIAAFITEASGGQGAFREAVEWVIDQQGRTKEIYQILREQVLTG
ncbi:MAG TPA: HAD hydrolase family protein, partial [Candidatus Marinimicrobia bacterium]|nr:HAD hydrolase family protein [Candidatus Neomarinimicrobiota bacterium]